MADLCDDLVMRDGRSAHWPPILHSWSGRVNKGRAIHRL